MDQDNLALDILIKAILERHQNLRTSYQEGEDVDFVDFPDDQIESMVKALWVDRYTTSRKVFEDTVSQFVGTLVADL